MKKNIMIVEKKYMIDRIPEKKYIYQIKIYLLKI